PPGRVEADRRERIADDLAQQGDLFLAAGLAVAVEWRPRMPRAARPPGEHVHDLVGQLQAAPGVIVTPEGAEGAQGGDAGTPPPVRPAAAEGGPERVAVAIPLDEALRQHDRPPEVRVVGPLAQLPQTGAGKETKLPRPHVLLEGLQHRGQ